MDRICFYSDDSYSRSGRGRRDVVVAGVAIRFEREAVRRQLEEIERTSKKGTRDWRTTDEYSRENYIEAVQGIVEIEGQIFYQPFDALPTADLDRAKIETLSLAITKFSPGNGRCYHEIFPEGVRNKQVRHSIRRALVKRGHDDVSVFPAIDKKSAEARLADAIAGYVRGQLYCVAGEQAFLHNIPHTFKLLGP